MMGIFDQLNPQMLGAMNAGAFAPIPIRDPAEEEQSTPVDISQFLRQAPPVKPPNFLQKIGAVLADTSAGLRGDLGDKNHPSASAALMAPQTAAAGGAIPPAQLAALGKALFPNDPKAQFLVATGNKDFLTALSDQYKFHTVNAGDYVSQGGGPLKQTSKLVDHEGVYGSLGPDGYRAIGRAAPSVGEEQTILQNDPTNQGGSAWARVQENLRGLQGLSQTDRHNRAEEGIGYGNLDVSRQNVGLRGKELESKLTPGGGKPMPVSMQRAEDADITAIQGAGAINSRLATSLDQLETGKLKLGPVENLVNAGKNKLGISTPESANFASFRANLEKMRNDSLRLNAGVQTEGDAQRAWKELFDGINDERVVKQRLKEIQAINDQAVGFKQDSINLRRQRNNAEPLDAEAYDRPSGAKAPAAPKSGAKRIRFDAKGNIIP